MSEPLASERMDPADWAPYAAAMRAFHRGDRRAAMVVYDDYERDEVPLRYFFRGVDELPPLERHALALCRGRVLDVGAGSGSHALALQARGLEVTAIEVLPELVTILRERGVRDARLASWMSYDGPRCDTVLVMMNGLGLAETLAGLTRFLDRMREVVRRGGQVIADSTDVRVRMDPDAGRSGRLERADGRYIGELHFQIEFKGRKGGTFSQLYVDPGTLREHASVAGWDVEMLRVPDELGQYLVRLTPGRAKSRRTA
jgi:SAM-dependent methyltransferase